MKNKIEKKGASMAAIKRVLRHYRKLVETHPDPNVKRIAQGMETALRWATENTRGWRMKDEPELLADCLKNDLQARRKT